MAINEIKSCAAKSQELKSKIGHRAALLAEERSKKTFYEKMAKANLYPEKIKEAEEAHNHAREAQEAYYKELVADLEVFAKEKMVWFEVANKLIIKATQTLFQEVASSMGSASSASSFTPAPRKLPAKNLAVKKSGEEIPAVNRPVSGSVPPPLNRHLPEAGSNANPAKKALPFKLPPNKANTPPPPSREGSNPSSPSLGAPPINRANRASVDAATIDTSSLENAGAPPPVKRAPSSNRNNSPTPSGAPPVNRNNQGGAPPVNRGSQHGGAPPVNRNNQGGAPPVKRAPANISASSLELGARRGATEYGVQAANDRQTQQAVGGGISKVASNRDFQSQLGNTIASQSGNPMVASIAKNRQVQEGVGKGISYAATNETVQKEVGKKVGQQIQNQQDQYEQQHAEGEYAEEEYAEGEYYEDEYAEGEYAEGEYAEGEYHEEGEAGAEAPKPKFKQMQKKDEEKKPPKPTVKRMIKRKLRMF